MVRPESFNIVEFLSKWYIQQTMYADSARKIDDNIVEVGYTVKDYHCDPAKKPNLRGEIVAQEKVTTNTFIIDGTQPPHTEGHLRGMPIFQGHLADGALIETATYDRSGLWLAGFRTIAHAEPGVPGDIAVATTTLMKEEEDVRTVRGVFSCEDRVHTRAFDMKFEEGPALPSDGVYLSQHQLFEIGAQAAGGAIALLYESVLQGERDPIFDSIGPSTLGKIVIRPDEVLTSRVKLRRITDQGAFYVDITMRKQDETVTTLGNLGIGFLPHDLIKARIDELQHVS